MKYHLFAGEVYYATGGVNDYKKSSDDLSELLDEAVCLEKNEHNFYHQIWWHICDESFKIIKHSEDTPYGV